MTTPDRADGPKGFTLDDILRDTLKSTYIDDAYYDKLGVDLGRVAVDRGAACGRRIAKSTRRSCCTSTGCSIAGLLSAGISFTAATCVYWVPAVHDMPDPVAGRPAAASHHRI